MKKTIFLLITLIFWGFTSLQAQDTIVVSGYVSNELNGDPVVNHDVSIMLNDSTSYFSTVSTDQNGFYMDMINSAGFMVTSIYIFTNDLCTYGIHDTLIQNPGSQVYADFEICVDSIANPECQADFYYVSDSLGQNTIQFFDNSTSTLTINSWTWSFGDGTTSTIQNPIHNYASAGTYNVCLSIEASGSGGTCTDTYCMNVIVQSGGGNDCMALFYYTTDSTGGNYNVINFYDLSIPVGLIESWFWDFDDGTTSTEQNPVHTFNIVGNYNVCLTITSDSGSCTSTECMIVQIQGGGGGDCEADFYYVSDSSGQNTIQFFDNSTAMLTINSWTWDFGDGNTSTVQDPIHNYANAGTYYVCLTIEASGSGAMCTDTYCMDVIVQTGGGNDCEADFYYTNDSTGVNSTVVHFFDLSTPVGSIDSWFWDFGFNNTSTEQNPVHDFINPGIYNVCLTIQSSNAGAMCTDTYCMDVVVQTGGGDCQADFCYTIDSTGGISTVVNFFDLSIPAPLIDTWYWDFGDGTTSTEQNPVHAYNAFGIYTVCLTITTDSISCTSTYCSTIIIQGNDNLYLGGNIFADIYQLDHGFAYAYKEENGIITEVFSNIVDSLGYYLFYPMAPADYYVKAEPSPSSAYFGTHMPTYYGDVAFWDDAVLINLDDNVYTADINLIPVSQAAGGPGQITGIIEYSGGTRENTPAIDIQIMLANEQSEFVGLTYSDDEGKFEFTTLPYGTFTLYAEVMGIQMTPKDYFITEENAIIDDVSMIITDDEIYFGPDGIESIYIDDVSNVYPNPISNTLKLDIGIIKPTAINVKIYNQMGQALIMEQFNMSSAQTIEVNTSGLQSGMYFLEIMADDNYRIVRKFIK